MALAVSSTLPFIFRGKSKTALYAVKMRNAATPSKMDTVTL